MPKAADRAPSRYSARAQSRLSNMKADNINNTRHLSAEMAAELGPGADHYRAYVGHADQYDFMGATQFRLLTALGLRENHNLLDFGCGSLRAGRLFIPYLLPGRYFGLDPNKWLIEEAIDRELGRDIIELKRPTFRHDDDFRPTRFNTSFDFIVAQSIFSHTGSDLVVKTVSEFSACLNPGGLALATFLLPHQMGGAPEFTGTGWVYPDCVAYEPDTITSLIARGGLVGRQLSWFHPRQTWFVMARSVDALPPPTEDADLSGKLRSDVLIHEGWIRRLRNAAVRRIKALRT
jgi:SAM-dependent methyltransferase